MSIEASPFPAGRRLKVQRPSPVAPGRLPVGDPEGGRGEIEVGRRYLLRAGRPWFPVSGEVHFSRIRRSRWAEVIRHAKAGGINTIATYVFWQAHEPVPGDFRWHGDLDLRAFLQLVHDNEIEALVRLGPWAHGEARYGGFPDWVAKSGLKTRTNDPAYLELVRRLYGQIVDQLKGMTYREGGPVIGVQVDNELYDQPEHLSVLRQIAEEMGLRVPIWTATGWGSAEVPSTLLPLYSAYSDGFWEGADVEWPEFAPAHFRYGEVRDDLAVGRDLREALDGIVLDAGTVPRRSGPEQPFATCELGGGMHVAYHRRPLVRPEDVAALALAKIGSGSIWQGYYMYAGGTQRVGPHGPEHESHATGYPNDVPTRSYDFNAPIGEHQQVRLHHHLLRRQHLWLEEDGEAIATMTTTVGGGSDDAAELRWAVRSDGARGYLFLSTYQPSQSPLAAQPGVRVAVEFPDDLVVVPSSPVDLPPGTSVAWPLLYPLTETLILRSATAQLLTRIALDDTDVVVLVASDGVPVELVLQGDLAQTISVDRAPGPECLLELHGVRLLILDEASANRLYRLPVAGRERLVLSTAPVYGQGGGLVVHSPRPWVDLAMMPSPGRLLVGGAAVDPRDQGSGWGRWRIEVPHAGDRVLPASLRTDRVPPREVATGGPCGRLSAPTDWSGAERLRLDLSEELLVSVDRLLLRVDWTGDIARALIDGEVVADQFWHGPAWEIDLTAHRRRLRRSDLVLEFLPWREAAGVWVDPLVRGTPDGVRVREVRVVRIGRLALRCAAEE